MSFRCLTLGGSGQFLRIDVQSLLLKETNTYTAASLTPSCSRIYIDSEEHLYIWLVSSAVTDIIITICMFSIVSASPPSLNHTTHKILLPFPSFSSSYKTPRPKSISPHRAISSPTNARHEPDGHPHLRPRTRHPDGIRREEHR